MCKKTFYVLRHVKIYVAIFFVCFISFIFSIRFDDIPAQLTEKLGVQRLQELNSCYVLQGQNTVCTNMVSQLIQDTNKFLGRDLYDDEYTGISQEEIDMYKKFKSHDKLFDTYYTQAINNLLDGKIAYTLLFAGAGTRLGAGSFYSLSPFKLLDNQLDNKKNIYVSEFGLGELQLLQMSFMFSRLYNSHKNINQEVCEFNTFNTLKLPLIVNVSSEHWDEVKKSFIKNKFFGFDPTYIYFYRQEFRPVYNLLQNNTFGEQTHTRLPIGHGELPKRWCEPSSVVQLSVDGQEFVRQESAYDLLEHAGVTTLVTHRVNDLTLIGECALDLNQLAFVAYQFDSQQNIKSDIVIELVANPHKQKGGTAIKRVSDGKSMLIEGFAVPKDTGVLHRLIEQLGNQGAPYNKFALAIRLSALPKFAQNIPMAVRFFNGSYTLESAMGDGTQSEDVSSTFLVKTLEDTHIYGFEPYLIHDVKERKDLEKACAFITSQYAQDGFCEFVQNLSQ